MTFYQELQLSPAGSKSYIASFENPKDKLKHMGIFLFKDLLYVAFATVFITLFSIIFGKENSIVGLVALLSIMVFRGANLGIRTSHGVVDIFIVFGILAVGPKVSNMLPAGWAFCINLIAILLLALLGCHNVIMYNHSTVVLSYILLWGYGVSGEAYKRRLAGLFVAALMTALIYYQNHRKETYKRTFKSLFQEFNLSSARTRWQLRLAFTVSSVLLIASLLNIPKAMWFGIAAMSVCVPFRNDMKYRVKYRAPGNVLGAVIFLAAYWILPESTIPYLGILGGIGTGLSASYGWQTVFNAFSAISVATQVFGMPLAIFLRIFNNAFGSIYAWLFDKVFEPILSAMDSFMGSLNSKRQSDIEIME